MTRNLKRFASDIGDFQKRISRAFSHSIPREIGTQAVETFRDSFNLQRMNRTGSESWQEVKRRDPSSGWYGHKTGARQSRPGRKHRPGTKYTHFSRPATTRAILAGSGSQDLQESIRSEEIGPQIRIQTDKVSAELHNEGGRMSVFGKHSVIMPKREFIGDSDVLESEIKEIIEINLTNIFTQ